MEKEIVIIAEESKYRDGYYYYDVFGSVFIPDDVVEKSRWLVDNSFEIVVNLIKFMEYKNNK